MKLVEVSLRLGLVRVLVVQDPGEIAADHEQRRQRFAGSAESPFALIDRCFQVSPPGRHDTEGDACFSLPHGCPHGSVEVGAGLDDLAGEGLGQARRSSARCR